MHVLAVGFWGAFFGTVALMLAAGLLAHAQSHRSVALAAGMTGVLSAVFAAIAQMVAQAFQRQQHQGSARPVVPVGVSVGDFHALENLHRRAALNHALFAGSGRLRRCVPADVAMGRLFEDSFLLVSRNARDLDGLVRLGPSVAARLSQPVTLRTTGGGDGNGGGRAPCARP